MKLAPPLQQIGRTHLLFRGRRLIYFGGCDYFRLSSHPKVIGAARAALQEFGLNVAASRLTTGNHIIYERLEKVLVRFFGAESAVLVSNGYATNLIVAQALTGKIDCILLDEKAHPSLADAARLLACPVRNFQHCDADDFLRHRKRCRPGAKIALLTDGVFAHSGSVAPLRKYLPLLPRNAVVVVDDAHGAGVIGARGGGTLEFEGARDERVIQTVTLSKAIGAYGGAILCQRPWRDKILATGMFGAATPMPLPLAAAAIAGLGLLAKDRKMRERLRRNVQVVESAMRHAGLPSTGGHTPIFGVQPRRGRIEPFKRALLRNGIYPTFIVYPGGPGPGYFRFAISSEHSAADLGRLIRALPAAR